MTSSFIGPLRPGQKPPPIRPDNNQSSSSSLYPVSSAAASSSYSSTQQQDAKRDIGKAAKPKKFIRVAGGSTWEDPTLSEWDPNDFRAFCGDLGTEVTDELLTRTFSEYPSFSKAKVIRDKRTAKSKGFGFVSFKDPQDFARAIKEWDGQYLGSRPIKLRKSTWRDRNVEVKRTKIPNIVNNIIQKAEDFKQQQM